jgi:hypothetical protein
MTFEFMYSGECYKYEDGSIRQPRGNGFSVFICPVSSDLKNKLNDLSADQLQSIMVAILHGYFHGFDTGRRDKIKEFKRVFDID